MSQLKELPLPIDTLWSQQYHEEEVEINKVDLTNNKFQIESSPFVANVVSFMNLFLTEDMKTYLKLNFLQQTNSSDDNNFEELSLLACHSSHELLAVTNKQITLIYTLKDILAASNNSTVPLNPIILKNHRLNGKVLSLAWTNEHQNTLLIGTTNGLSYIICPSYSSNQDSHQQQFDTANININFVQNILNDNCSSCPVSVDFLSTSPKGRYYCFSSHQKRGKLFLGDYLMGNNGTNIIDYSSALSKTDVVNGLSYSPDGAHVLASFK
jgi:hypothetical protein